MAQVTSGIRKLLSRPFFYDLFQDLVGASRVRQILCRDYLGLRANDVVVDVGCGTCEILAYMPDDTGYFGFDLSSEYIDAARSRYGHRGTFRCADITELPADAIPRCDVAIAVGVLHHLDDEGANVLLHSIRSRLGPGGRLVTIDPALEPGQSLFARELIKRDRGQNVRSGQGYLSLAENHFRETRLSIRHDLLHIPYTHAVLEYFK